MTSTRSTTLLAAVFVAGLVVGLLAGGALLGNVVGAGSASVDPADPPWSVSEGVGCASDHARNASGWLVETNARDGTAFAFNRTFADTGGVEIDLRSSPETRSYTLVVTTGGDRVSKPGTPPADCQPATSVQASVTLPDDYATFSVVRNGETVVRVRNSGDTVTRVRDLDERNATG